MNSVVVDNVDARFLRLTDGSWGASVISEEDLSGREVVITRKNGAQARKRLGSHLGRSKAGRAIYTFYDSKDRPIQVVTNGIPEELKKLIIDTLDSEDDDALYGTLLKVAEHFGLR